MSTSDPVAPDRVKLAKQYSTPDDAWCSDYEGIRRLAVALGAAALSDEQAKQVLRTLDPALRWAVEMTTGVWYGTPDVEMRDHGLGPAAGEVGALYEAGLALAKLELQARYLNPGPFDNP